MQLLPSTAARLGVDPYDAAQNLEGGERYLAQLLTKYRGDVGGALAEYSGAKSQYSPQGQDYIRNVEAAAGISVGSIIVNVPPSAMTPQQHVQAVKEGVRLGIDEHTRHLLVALNGAYQ
jgi:soluble lytic murein transglycosylase-like protein